MLKIQPLNTRLACALVASMVTIGVAAATSGVREPSPRPTLVVGIFVEGLDADYVELLRSNFGPDGFNRFISDGVSIPHVDYGPGIDATAATAMLVSGASPAVNGIPAARAWDSKTRREYPVLLDPKIIGDYSERSLTPAPLLVSTLADEVRIADGGLGVVHSIAPDPQAAILMAGHAANSAFWISDVTGKWTTSGHYRETPQPISRRNVGHTLAVRLDTIAWEPALKLDRYPDLPEYKKLYPFRHTFPSREADRFKIFKTSAPANREVASTAAEYISTLSLGTRGVTDMLSLGFNVSPYLYGRDADNRIETMDAYVRLDGEIANIIRAVEKGPGMDRTLFFIAGTPAPSGGKRDEERWNIPSGQFSPRKAVSLLNMYLMALHGNGEWVNGYHNGYFFLNRPLIKERGLSEADLRREGADFLSRMSGVSDVYTIDDILARRAGDTPSALRRNISATHAGDLLVMVNPGWEISDSDDDSATLSDSQPQLPVVRWQASTSPVYILAPTIQASEITGTVDARTIAPTVARILRIRSPNAAALPPLSLPAR
ncbi:MAG: alkaline phosphatase family protein [Muribaculaceae bacterium]|nr:alkaline phosphatase family protein [Muribaculaceae bacterium]